MGILKKGDKVKIKSLKWYKDNCDCAGRIETEGNTFVEDMKVYCGREAIITHYTSDICFQIDIDNRMWGWTISMVDLKEPKNELNYSFIKFGEFYIAFNKDSLVAIPEFFNSEEDAMNFIKKEGT